MRCKPNTVCHFKKTEDWDGMASAMHCLLTNGPSVRMRSCLLQLQDKTQILELCTNLAAKEGRHGPAEARFWVQTEWVRFLSSGALESLNVGFCLFRHTGPMC